VDPVLDDVEDLDQGFLDEYLLGTPKWFKGDRNDFFTGKPMKELWKPIDFITAERAEVPLSDCLFNHIFVPIISDRAVKCLYDLLEPNGELLEINYDSGEGQNFFIYNTTCVLDILDTERSNLDEYPKKENIFFREDLLSESTPAIFLLEQRKSGKTIWLFATDRFVDRVKNNNLTGFAFEKFYSDSSTDSNISTD
jgi:hypothetical protein